MQNQAAEIKIRAERRIGEMLGERSRKQGQRDETFHDERFAIPKLKDLGISELQSHRWQLSASVPEEVLEQHITEIKNKGKELTSASVHQGYYIDKFEEGLQFQDVVTKALYQLGDAEKYCIRKINLQTIYGK
jgi:hypothetical protein